MKRITIISNFLVLMFIMLLVACGSEDAGKKGINKSITIGMVNELSGPAADFGITTVEGAELAIEEINSSGGVLNGVQLKLISEDNESTPEGAVNAIQKLINQDQVDLIAGGNLSSINIAAREATRGKIFHIVSAAQAKEITDDGHEWLLAMNLIPEKYSESLLNFIISDLKPKSVSILSEDTDFGEDNVNLAENMLKEAGIEVKSIEWFTHEDTNFESKVAKIKSSEPDLLYIINAAPNISGQILKTVSNYGVSFDIVHSPATLNNKVIELASGAAEGVYTAEIWSVSLDNEINQNFVKAYKEKYGKEADKTAAFGYLTIKFIADLINKVEDYSDYDEMAKVAKNNTWDTIIGEINFDETGRNINNKEIIIQQVYDGQLKQIN